MAVQVGRTVISFTIKFVQSEKEKLKSDISKVLDGKHKSQKQKQQDDSAIQVEVPIPNK